MTALPFASDRLAYEPLQLRHAVALDGVLTDPRVNSYFIEGGPSNVIDLENSFARKIEGPGDRFPGEVRLDHAVRLKEADLFIGRVEATVQGRHAEVAYLLGPAFWGYGYGREAACWIERTCAERYGVSTFWATVIPANERSARLLTALGYSQVEKPSKPVLTSYDDGDLVFRRKWNGSEARRAGVT